jgi:hypothetical protein
MSATLPHQDCHAGHPARVRRKDEQGPGTGWPKGGQRDDGTYVKSVAQKTLIRRETATQSNRGHNLRLRLQGLCLWHRTLTAANVTAGRAR